MLFVGVEGSDEEVFAVYISMGYREMLLTVLTPCSGLRLSTGF